MNRSKALSALLILLALLMGFSQLLFAASSPFDPHRALIKNWQRMKHAPAAAQSAGLLKNSSLALLQASGTGSISGRVAGLDSSALGTATVIAWPADSLTEFREPGKAMVDSTFSYHIDSLVAGNYFVMVGAEGYYSLYYNNVAEPDQATPVAVVVGQVTANIDFNMVFITPGTGSISGLVTRENDQTPIAFATVYVHSSDAPFYYGKSQSDESGRYVIDELKSGTYIAEVYADGFIQETYNNAGSYGDTTGVEVVEPLETTDINFSLSQGSSINGTITNVDGHPLPNIYVEAYTVKKDSIGPDFYISQSGYSDEDGRYSILGLLPGSYYIRADYWSSWYGLSIWYANVTNPELATPINLAADQDLFGIDFQFNINSPQGQISGRVTDGSAQPIANATIQVQTPPYDTADNVKWYYGYANTDAEGFYRVENIPDGRYMVCVWAQNGWQSIQRYWPDAETPEGAKLITIDNTTPSWELDFSLPIKQGAAGISGTVHAQDGRPLMGAFVQLSPGDNAINNGSIRSSVWAFAYTDSLGFYAIKGLPEGSYIAYSSHWENLGFGQQWFENADSARFATPIVLSENEHRRGIDFSLNIHPIHGTIAGTVFDAVTGLALSRAYVEIKPIWRNSDMFYRPWAWFPSYAITDDAGQYRVEGLSEGSYLVSVHANGGFAYYPDAIVADQASPVKIIGGQVTTADFKLVLRNDGTGSIAGAVSIDISHMLYNQGSAEDPVDPAFDSKSTPDIAVIMAKPAITILIWPQSELYYTAIIDKEGHYLLSGLPAGDYYVSCFAPGNVLQYFNGVYDPSEAKLITIKEAEKVTDVDFELKPQPYRFMDGPNKEGNFSNGVTGQVINEENKPLANAVVYLLDEAGTPVSFTTTDENGNYQLSGLPPGNYLLQAGKIGYATTFNGNVQEKNAAQYFTLVSNVVVINLTVAPQGTTDVDPVTVPMEFYVHGNYPNPFNPETTIKFSLPGQTRLTLRIFNALGQEVKTLFDGTLISGYHELKWDGTDHQGLMVVSGLYFYRFEGASFAKTGKMIYMR